MRTILLLCISGVCKKCLNIIDLPFFLNIAQSTTIYTMYHFKNIGVKNMIVCQFVDIKSLSTQSGGKQTQNFVHIDIDANKN